MTKNFHLSKTRGNFKIFLLVSTIEMIILWIVSKSVWQHYLYRALIMKATSISIRKLSSFQLHTKLKGFAYIVGFKSIWAPVIGLCKFLFLFCFCFVLFLFFVLSCTIKFGIEIFFLTYCALLYINKKMMCLFAFLFKLMRKPKANA